LSAGGGGRGILLAVLWCDAGWWCDVVWWVQVKALQGAILEVGGERLTAQQAKVDMATGTYGGQAPG
jgi:hypothetical protein